uniref:WD_REPEATS_REGION domain-containing protein n=1 Tax=Mesocestoides corti TaxID=53468 RepID=A0A5K3FEU2_MESCO
MALAPLLLSSVSGCGKQDAVVVYDPVAGNTVASFSGETATRGTLTALNDVIFSAVAKKPLLQMWSFQSNSSFKRLTTKGVVNALAFTHDGSFMYLAIEKSIYVYQVCSGCLITVLEASHMAPIGCLLMSQRQAALCLPLLVSADTSGLVACWPALVAADAAVTIGDDDCTDAAAAEKSSCGSHKPLWYVVQASRSLPSCAFVADGRMVACAGTDGLKLFGAETGRFVYSALGQSRPLLCVCALPHDDTFVFAGTDNGILHSVWMKNPEVCTSYEVSFRRCFAETELSSTDKAICCVCASPPESSLRLLAVGTRSGLVEVLRLDACLVRLQRFSVCPSEGDTAAAPRITGLVMMPRPSWLLEEQSLAAAAPDQSPQDAPSDPLAAIRPLKRQLGWQPDDILYLKLPNPKQNRTLDSFVNEIYQDDFLLTKPPPAFAVPVDAVVTTASGRSETSAELQQLKEEKKALEKKNGELMRILVANCLHY